jgi:hypothetical protein
VFIHGSEQEWHNDVVGLNTVDLLRKLRFDAVESYGFVNLRCLHEPGCPSSLHPSPPLPIDIEYEEVYQSFPAIYSEVLRVPMDDVPMFIGSPCCAQFAVTRDQILQRPKSDYSHMLEWTRNSGLKDSFAVGFAVERLWHIIFGMPAMK